MVEQSIGIHWLWVFQGIESLDFLYIAGVHGMFLATYATLW